MSLFSHYATQAYLRCDELAKISADRHRINRQYLTTEHARANALVIEWMHEAGLKTWVDEVGNAWGRFESEHATQSLIIGSHLDTVPNAGRYDGILGVTCAISLLQYCGDANVSFPFHIDVVAFADEEGSRFGTTLIGSKAIAGDWQAKWALLTDSLNIDLATAMRTFGLDVNNVTNAALNPASVLGYLEMHIEQGPVLEALESPVGIVTGIAGAKRFAISVTGESGHAGTVPMAMRKDALVVASKMILQIKQLAEEGGVTATVGKLRVIPNAVNVIPGLCEFSLDIRSVDDERRDRALDTIIESMTHIAEQCGVNVSIKETHRASAVLCDEQLSVFLEEAIRRNGIAAHKLHSGAGHDAMAVANLCPVSMLFLRCKGGISHHPDESVVVNDIDVSLAVMYEFLQIVGKHQRSD